MGNKTSKQQKAGDNSQQVQADLVVIKSGIEEKRVREIVDEKLQVALADFTSEASSEASRRNGVFGKKLVDKMTQENALTAFSDPAFQMLLVEAQKRAASTERTPDYDLLTELMVHRFKKGSNRNIRAGISRAVEIVDQVSDEALLGLTVIHSLTHFVPVSGRLAEGLKTLDDLFGKLLYAELPEGTDWLDHLDILDAVRISSLGSMKKLEDYWYESFSGYTHQGVTKESDEHKEALDILKSVDFPESILEESETDKLRVKLNVRNEGSINDLTINTGFSARKPTGKEIQALKKLFDLCKKKRITKQEFTKKIDEYGNLKILREWWNKLNHSIQITSVGKVLAHSNAQRVDSSLPPLN